LVAVEYIVIDVGQPAPTHWSLHVWLWKDNPNGLFAAFNPDVSCP
jgi:hypothetical protein